ncbi:peptidoglycan editing factor PgeF [Henriciella marina]|uniref:Purine nucleoside phosphorylase n=1 Tax=Henriciella marina TaxID=453851 RepID=A0ABT4M092_9PROT|nr:peptidoglycan editing factor PgeF [Henriciella marina]MCZ4299208.1 peptidoglycan editing factor PgeF [Henriciella marina]
MATIPHVLAPRLAGMNGIKHGFFGRQGGTSEGIYDSLNLGIGSEDKPKAVMRNRRLVSDLIGTREVDHMLSCYQVHSDRAILATMPWGPDRPQADGMVTNLPCIALCILTADCVPVLFADRKASVIGACHAGWKGALAGICEATIAKMEETGANRKDIYAAVGPCIGQKSYEVGPEFRDEILSGAPWAGNLFHPGEGDRFHFNIETFVKNRLVKAGLAFVEVIGHDTCELEDMYFSNRRRNHFGEPDYGRQGSVIMLEG